MKIVAAVLGIIVFALAIGLLWAFMLMVLWNWLIPSLFGGPVITVWQAWGLGILFSIVSGLVKVRVHHEK